MNREFIHGDLAGSVTGEQRVALVRATEEAAELQKEVAKALRFGIENRYPAEGPTNAEKIRAELDDLHAALADAGIIVLPIAYDHDAIEESQATGDLPADVARKPDHDDTGWQPS